MALAMALPFLESSSSLSEAYHTQDILSLPFFLLSVTPDNVWRERESEVPPFLGTSELVGSSEEVGWTEDITH